MEAQLEQIRESQKATWNKFSPGWRKWDDFTMNFLKPMGDEIIRELKLSDTDVALDVAAGTGEPGLTIAQIVTKGKVVITDLAEGMLEVANDHIKAKGITNAETRACDVCELPFADNTFDAISCRMGFMFFPDMLMAAKEMRRVLKPGGRIATSVWSTPGENPWITATMSKISANIDMPAPPPGAPGMFRAGAPGMLADLFRQAGLKNVSETPINEKVTYKNPEFYWTMMNEVAAPVVAALSKADDATKAKIKREVMAGIDQKHPTGEVSLDFGALVVYGEK